jgi:acetolactate synthase I/II/III large subunit
MKLSDYVFQFIADQGVKHVFMLPGGGAMHLNDSLGKRRDLAFICNLHEQASAIACEAYARVTGNLGVCSVTCGPGGTNAITGLAGAWLESTPCLFLSGQVKRADLKGSLGVRQLGVQELDIVEIVRSITKYAVTVTDPTTIRFHLEKAVALARHGRPGPVWLDLPLDIQAAPIDSESLIGFDRAELPPVGEGPERLKELAAQTIQLLNGADRPVLLVGNGIHGANAEKQLRQLVDRLQIPVLRTWIGADLLPDDHALSFGKPGVVAARGANFTLQNADFVLSVGARLDFAVTGYDQSQFARAARKIVVDIDRAELAKLKKLRIDIPICADAGNFLNALLGSADKIQSHDRKPWLDRCREWKARYPVVTPDFWRQADYINTYVFTSVLSDEMADDDVIIPGSSGAAIDTFWLALRLKGRQRAIATGGLGAMGFGLPAALGGAVGAGGRRVISVDGDGGFQLNIQELATVARLGLPIKFFVLNNNGYASIRASQRNYFKTWMACDPESGLKLPSTTKVAEAYGIPTSTIVEPSELRQGIRKVLDAPGPWVCEVMVDPDQSIGPRVSSAVRPDGSMVSRPLEDLWPFLDRDEFRSNMLVDVLPD